MAFRRRRVSSLVGPNENSILGSRVSYFCLALSQSPAYPSYPAPPAGNGAPNGRPDNGQHDTGHHDTGHHDNGQDDTGQYDTGQYGTGQFDTGRSRHTDGSSDSDSDDDPVDPWAPPSGPRR